MPPPTKGKLKRQSSFTETEAYKFDGGRTRETERKRNRGQISCAECRRLKIKCDKQIPCQSCQRRGCAQLCPNGSLSTGQGTRFVLAATEHLHCRIARFTERIQQLEDALSDLQAKTSTEPHPLLCEDALLVNHQDDEPITLSDEPRTADHSADVLEAFGTLSIVDNGISRFFGPAGGSECLLMSDSTTQEKPSVSTLDLARDRETSPLSQYLRMFSQAFPLTPIGPTGAVRELIESYLPNWERASYLAQMYCERAGWIFHGVSKDQIMDELLPIYYSNGPVRATDDNENAHELALLFLVFAIGALVDPTEDPGNVDAEHYHQIARAAICLQPVLEKPSLVSIQALHLLSIYNAASGNELSTKETSTETTRSLIVLAARLAQTVGLHRDSARWGLPDKIVQRRRIVFWDLFVADVWHCLDTGRPPSFSLAYIDCRYPGTGNSDEKRDTDLNASFETWGYRFAAECLSEVAARTLTAETPSYTTIMELDRKVRAFAIPEFAAHAASSVAGPLATLATDDLAVSASMGRYMMAHAREVVLLYLHRSFFAQAIIDSPVNPLKSQYAPSFLAAYRASSTILRTVKAQYASYPQLCAFFWKTWEYSFSAAIVFGTIVTRGPCSPLAFSAIKELDEACTLFTKVASRSRRAAKALPILTKLNEKAHHALTVSQNENPSGQMGRLWSPVEEGDDELTIFSGRTRFVSAKPLENSKQAPEGQHGQSSVPEQEQPLYSARCADDTIRCAQLQDIPHYSYVPPHHTPPPLLTPASYAQPASQHAVHEHSTATTPSRSWDEQFSGASSHVGSAAYSTGQRSQPGGYPSYHPETSSTVLYQQPRQQHLSPQTGFSSKFTGLGLVCQESQSRLNECWRSFVHDSGYFEGFS